MGIVPCHLVYEYIVYTCGAFGTTVGRWPKLFIKESCPMVKWGGACLEIRACGAFGATALGIVLCKLIYVYMVYRWCAFVVTTGLNTFVVVLLK